MPFSGQTARAQLKAATTPLITNKSVPAPATEVSHTLNNKLKYLSVKCRTDAILQIAFTATESGTKYITIPKHNEWEIDLIDFSSKTLYIQASKACTVEILELY